MIAMKHFSLFHLSDGALRSGLTELAATSRSTTAMLVAHIAEFDARRLYAREGYPSMKAYCVGALHLSDDAAFKRIGVARAAREHPGILSALADGRLHLTAVLMLASRLTRENAEELLDAATHNTRNEIETLLAERFPAEDVPARVEPIEPLDGVAQLAP
jgi:hypothetical protein